MATLLDELLIKIKAETSQAEQGLERTEQKSESLNKSFVSLAAKALGAFAAVGSVGQAISGAIARAGDVHLMNQTAESIGLAVGEMDAFRRSIQDTGGTAQGATSTLEKMAQAMGGALADVNSGQAKVFSSMGISLKNVDGTSKDAMQGILDLAGAVEGMDKAQARFKIRSLGIEDQKSIELILKGRKEIEAMTRAHKEQGVVTREQAIQAAQLDNAMNAMRGGMDRAGLSIMDMLLPAIIKGVEWLTKMVDWANENKNVVVGFFGAIAAVVAAIYLPAMISAAAATLAATWPIIAIAAVVAAAAAAFALLYDDVMAFVEGNDSFIGQIFEKYPMVKTIVFGIIDAFKAMGTALMAVFKMILDGWQGIFGIIMAGVDQVMKGVRSVASFFGIGGGTGQEAAGAQLSTAQASPLNATTSAAISNIANGGSETNVPIGQITINTQATDAAGISRDLNSELQGQLRDLDAQTATGVAR